MTNFTPQFITELKDRIDAVSLIGDSVELTPSGKSYKGKCPFHQEKTPSFHVYPVDQTYHCYGCGAHGSMIDFVMHQKGLKFPEAVKMLADLVGIPLPPDGKKARFSPKELHKFRVLYSTLEAAVDYYQKALTERSAGFKYLQTRGIQQEIIENFALGYAPNAFDSIKLALARVDERVLLDCGLITQSDKGKSYDKFRDRVMFPIRDMRGRTIAFGGRVVSTDQAPKYMNSPQSLVYNKSKCLYGMYEAWRSNVSLSSLIVVEGYMDVIALAQHGIENVVAPLGTALTLQQIQFMLKYCSEYVLCFDGDDAGATATWRALEHGYSLLKKGQRIRVVRLPKGDDPDSYISTHGVDQFHDLVERAPNSSAYFFKELRAQHDINDPEGQSAFVERARAVINEIPYDLYRDFMYSKLQDIVGHDIPSLGLRYNPSVGSRTSRELSSQRDKSTDRKSERLKVGERNTLRSLVHNMDVVPLISQKSMNSITELQNESLIFDAILRIRENELNNFAQLLASYENDSPEHRYLVQVAESAPPGLQETGLRDPLLNAIDTLIFRFKREIARRDV
ncbi:MAG: DNA primase [Gammaproteobacteria bacterium]|nr:DNA primase [Gammaproteobacteria bacterium]MYC25414.1 DNA primase [Gammaproteobacteria bacterium]